MKKLVTILLDSFHLYTPSDPVTAYASRNLCIFVGSRITANQNLRAFKNDSKEWTGFSEYRKWKSVNLTYSFVNIEQCSSG